MTTDVVNGVPREWLNQLHRDLDACQKLIWANLRGCDPAYCADAQARLAEIETMLATAQPADHSEHDLNMAAQPAADGEREAFEAWLSSLKFVSGQGPEHVAYCLHRDLSDKYTEEWVSDMYRGWQARAAQPQQAVAVTDVSTLKIALAELHKCGVKPGSLPHMVLTNLIDATHKTGEEE